MLALPLVDRRVYLKLWKHGCDVTLSVFGMIFENHFIKEMKDFFSVFT